MRQTFRFCEVGNVQQRPGVYEIYTNAGIPLKVGTGKDLRKRLLQHRASRQSGLKLQLGGDWNNPCDVHSKASILAKHLYYDGLIAKEYNLRVESGRQRFLEEQCYIVLVRITQNLAEAQALEKQLEREGKHTYRYIGKVKRFEIGN